MQVGGAGERLGFAPISRYLGNVHPDVFELVFVVRHYFSMLLDGLDLLGAQLQLGDQGLCRQ